MFKSVFLFILLTLTALFSGPDIHESIKKGDMESVRELIASKPELVNSRDATTATPLHTACTSANPEMVNLLIESGADLEAETKYGLTPLFSAVHSGSLEVADILLKKGSDVNHISRFFGTALHRAVYMSDSGMVSLLIANNADSNIKNPRGRTALHDAAIAGSTAISTMLLEAGADPNLSDNLNRNTLHWAVVAGTDRSGKNHSFELLKLFAPGCSNPDQKDNSAYTALAYAVENGSVESVYYLYRCGSDLNWVSPGKARSLLHICCLKGFGEIAKFLISSSVDTNKKDNDGLTPFDLAMKHGNHEVACLFKPGLDQYMVKNGAYYLNQDLEEDEAYIWKLDTRGWAVKTMNNLLIFDHEENGIKPDQPSLSNGWIDYHEIKNQNITVFYSAYHALPGTNEFIHQYENSLASIRYIHYREDKWRGPGNSLFIKGDTTISFPGLSFKSYETRDNFGMGSLGYIINSDGINIFYPNFFTSDFEVFKEEINKVAEFRPHCQLVFIDMSQSENPAFADYLINTLKPELVIPYNRSGPISDNEQAIDELITRWPGIEVGVFEDPGDVKILQQSPQP